MSKLICVFDGGPWILRWNTRSVALPYLADRKEGIEELWLSTNLRWSTLPDSTGRGIFR